MNRKKIKQIILNLEKVYNLNRIEKLAKKHQFNIRKGKVSAKSFLNLCTFLGEDLCSSSLSNLCAKLEANEKVSISPQALSKRFNEKSVNFLEKILHDMINFENEVLRDNGPLLKSCFNRITIVDSTGFKLDDKHADKYKGCGIKSSVKIQLQYDLLTGEFIHCELGAGSVSDAKYLPTLQSTIEKGDLSLKDLGYIKTADLKFIEENEAFYISRLKVNTNLYKEEEITEYGFKGKVTIRKRYSYVDIKSLVLPLSEGESIEFNNIYIGNTVKNSTKCRLILTKLTEECKRKKEINNKKMKDSGKIKGLEQNKWWLDFNCYITNVPSEMISMEQVHLMYTLRWQVEIMFKIWKSLFKIHEVRQSGLERIQCFIYGRLIMLLLTSTIVFTARNLSYLKTGKELSEIKSFGTVKQYFNEIYMNIFKGKIVLNQIFHRIVSSIERYGVKSKKKDKKTPFLILQSLNKFEIDLVKMAS
ncbi:MAG: IS4 family transposase [Clostridium sp.]|uniref:IS4 family transposase n=1 Tax=Clostridium sp. TaxID=1506 RepID=UPI003D6D8DC8